MNVRWFRSLHFKIASGVILTILMLAAVDFAISYLLYERQMVAGMKSYSANLSRITLRGILELAMLGRHPELLQTAVEHLVEEQVEELPTVRELTILDLKGNVRFSSNRLRLNSQLRKDQKGCRECHNAGLETPPVSSFTEVTGEEVLRAVTPIPNRPECHTCHDSARAVNGLLVMDLSPAVQWAEMRSLFGQLFLKTALTVLAILGVLGLLLNRVVIRRIARLTMLTDEAAIGNRMVVHPNIGGSDEITRLSESFTRMNSQVAASIHELRNQKLYLQELVDSLQDSLIVVDPEFSVEMANAEASSSWKGQLSTGASLRKTHLADSIEVIDRTFREGRPEVDEIRIQSPAGVSDFEVYCSPVWNSSGDVTRVIALFRDVTERKMMEKQISRTERLASLGQLAAGVAHEVNNPMAAISTSAEGLERFLESEIRMTETTRREVHDYLGTIGEAAVRCKEITQRLLSLSSDRGEFILADVDLEDLVNQVAKLLQHQAKERSIEIREMIPEGTTVLGDRNKLYQLLFNLLLNSIAAVPVSGVVQIRARQTNGAVEILVEDNGCGIEAEHLDRIFDPFFTTKAESRGTGLGLSLCEHIVHQHQGQISISSQKGEGTRVSILLPSAQSLM